MTKKLISFICIILFGIFTNTIVNAKYVFNNQFEIVNLNIDRSKPIIELINIENTNTGFEKYANKTHTISINVKFKDKNIDKVFCDKEHIKVKIDNNYVEISDMQFIKISEKQGEKNYKIQLKNVNYNGKLQIEFIKGTVIDTSKLENDKLDINTEIMIDNIAPSGTFTEECIAEGKVKGSVNLSENIRRIDGWEFSQDNLQITQVFTNNISYELPIIDYASNKTMVNIDITKATYINIIFASHNSEVGWTYGYGNYDVAGKAAIDRNALFKTEAIAFNFSGSVDNDFIQANTYINTYWGEGGADKVGDVIYKHGYNPDENTYKSMNSPDLVTIDGKRYFQLGGAGVNQWNNTDINGENPIPMEHAVWYLYGICGMKMRLKDYSKYSIIYQVYVHEIGWINACSDGQECMYSRTKPISAFRIALVPKTEKQFVIDTWNKDVSTIRK